MDESDFLREVHELVEQHFSGAGEAGVEERDALVDQFVQLHHRVVAKYRELAQVQAEQVRFLGEQVDRLHDEDEASSAAKWRLFNTVIGYGAQLPAALVGELEQWATDQQAEVERLRTDPRRPT